MPVKEPFKEASWENKDSAELCFKQSKYRSAASRYYYSLFILAKGILVNNYSYYTQFLEEYPNLTKQQRKRRNFPHNTIYIALTYYLQWTGQMEEHEVENFQNLWNKVYELRIQADYEEDRISHSDIVECREKFAILWERLNNVIY